MSDLQLARSLSANCATGRCWTPRSAKCTGVFFDGFAEKGGCPKGGGHSHTEGSRNFVLAHGPSGTQDPNWRYCTKCHALVKTGQEVAFPFPSPVLVNNGEHPLFFG